MKSIKQQLRRARLAVVALGLIGATPSAFAAGTDFGTDITNTASVNYSVSGVPQTAINSSPTGNSIPGTPGVPTTFKVDKKIIFVAEETNNAATVTSPGLTQVVTVFRVSNTSNGAQDYGLAADNIQPPAVIFGRTDDFDMSNFTYHISGAACSTATLTTPTFNSEPAVTHIEQLGEDTCVYVFVRSDTPVSPTAANGLASTIRLKVTATTDASNGVTAEVETLALDNPAVVDVVFADAGVLNGNTVRRHQLGVRPVPRGHAHRHQDGGRDQRRLQPRRPGEGDSRSHRRIHDLRAEQRSRDERCLVDGNHSGQHHLRRRLDHAQRRGAR